MKTAQSEALLEAAEKVIPGGVNSPVRAFRSVGGTPPFIARGKGAYLFDVDGNRFVDYVGSWGPLVLGHAHPAVVDAVCAAAERGTSYGAPTEAEIELAEMVVNAVSSIEMVRFVSSGTEAVMSALRVARAFTGRTRIVKFDGGYHGHADLLLAQAGSGLATLGLPASAGVPPAVVADTLTVSFNDLAGVEAVFEANPGQIAAIIVEPVAGNMGVVSPQLGFLAGLREVTRRDGALLIFDEVITGFRVAYGGAQALYGVIPDLTCLGKIIGGGLPVGAYGGRRDVMHMVAPLGPAYQAGTLSGNPLAMAAGIATLRQLQKPGVYDYLERLSAQLEEGMGQAAREAGAPFSCNRVGSMFTGFFTDGPIVDYASAKRSDTVAYARMFHAMLDAGFYLAPSQFEAGFMSLAHSEEDVAATISAAREAFRVARG